MAFCKHIILSLLCVRNHYVKANVAMADTIQKQAKGRAFV
jgi:hypothetical protein